MQLTKFQRKTLERYKLFQHESPTFIKLLKLSLPRAIPIYLYLLGFAALCYWFDAMWGASLFIGMFFGHLCYFIAHLRMISKIWSLHNDILDWDKINALLQRTE